MRRTALLLAGAALAGCGSDDDGRDDGERRARADAGISRAMAADRPTDRIADAETTAAGIAKGEPATDLPAAVNRTARGKRRRARGACAAALAVPTRRNARSVQAAILCLLNAERRSRGLRPLRRNRRLDRAATAHSRDMVAQRYFAHDSQDGRSSTDRVRASGYIRAGRGFVVGENIAWGGGSSAAAAAIVRLWMNSPPHRANILQRSFEDVGVGLALGIPVEPPGSGATYTINFGALN